MPSVNVKGSDENIIEKVLVLQPNVSAEDLQTIQEYVVSATATRISDLEAQVDTLEPIIQNIDTSEANAKASEDNAKISEDNAEDYSLKSKSYAVGTNNTYRAGDATDNAEYYKNQCEAIASSLAGALRPMGTIAFANLPALSTADVGDMYNISDDFVTTSDFTVGAGISYPAGSNVYKIQSDKWDVLVGSAVVGIKGNAESTYRKGNVNITPANIGAYSKSEVDTAISNLNNEIGVINTNIKDFKNLFVSEPMSTSATYTFSIPTNAIAELTAVLGTNLAKFYIIAVGTTLRIIKQTDDVTGLDVTLNSITEGVYNYTVTVPAYALSVAYRFS